MKKLIFNGCSFMAGDELVWEQYHKEHNRELLPWFSKKAQLTEINDIEFRNSYIEYRRNFNLPAMVSRKLECEWFDLSRDGKSNEAIALETIAHINTIDKAKDRFLKKALLVKKKDSMANKNPHINPIGILVKKKTPDAGA